MIPAPGQAMRVQFFLAVLLLFAGCTAPLPAVVPDEPGPPLPATQGVLHRAGGIPVDAASVVTAIGGQYSLGRDSTEPTIGVDDKGAIYMTAFDSGTPVIARSKDNGQTWTVHTPTLDATDTELHPTTFDPFVWVDRTTGRVFMDDLTPPCNLLSWSDDQGETWTTNPVACGTPLVNDHQSIITAKPRRLTTVGYPNLVYFCGNHVAFMGCAVSVNGGLTFLPQVPVGPTAAGGSLSNIAASKGCAAITGHLQSDHEGRVFLGTACDGMYPSIIITEDDGLTWNAYPISRDVEMTFHEVDFAADEAGGLYAVWSGEKDGKVWYSHSEDHGKTWAPAIDVTPPGVTATMFGAVAAGSPGKVAIAYVGTTIEGGYDGKPMGTGGPVGDILGEPDPAEWADANWHAYLTIMTDGQTADPLLQTVTANDPADPLARGLCGRTRCHGMNDFLDVQIGLDGRPWASFVDTCTQACVTDPTVHWDESVGFAASLVRGPALRGDAVELTAILAPPMKAA